MTTSAVRQIGGKTPRQMVFSGVFPRLRERYAATWGRPWPDDEVYNNSYLAELWTEGVAEFGVRRGRNAEPLYQWCLVRMRENHVFEAARGDAVARETAAAEIERLEAEDGI